MTDRQPGATESLMATREPSRRSGRTVIWPIVISMLLAACQTSNVQPSGGPSATVPGASTASSAASDVACDALLADLDGAADRAEGAIAGAGGSIGDLTSIFGCLGIVVLPEGTDQAGLDAAFAGTDPVVSVRELQLLLGAGGRLLMDLDSLVAELAAEGFATTADHAPITRSALDATIGNLAARTGPDGAAARLLVSLGRARVARTGTDSPDPLWAEARLDGLQFMILATALGLGSTDAAMAGHVQLVSARGSMPGPDAVAAANRATGWVWWMVDAFQGAPQRARNMLSHGRCVMLRQYATEIHPEQTPTDLWHDGGPGPSTGTIAFTLLQKHLSDTEWYAGGCPPPTGRPLGGGQYDALVGKTVEFQYDDAVKKHGAALAVQLVSDADGVVKAEYRTVPERTPARLQLPQYEQTEPATFGVRILDLFSDLPGVVMTTTGGPSKSKSVVIHWYEPDAYKLGINIDFVGTDKPWASSINVHGDIVMRATEPADGSGAPRRFSGTGTLTYTTTPKSGKCVITWQGSGLLKVNAEGKLGNPIDPSTFQLLLSFVLADLKGDTAESVGCNPDHFLSDKVSLLQLFVIATWQPKPTQGYTVGFTGWKASTSPGVIISRLISTSCGSGASCSVTGSLKLLPYP